MIYWRDGTAYWRGSADGFPSHHGAAELVSDFSDHQLLLERAREGDEEALGRLLESFRAYFRIHARRKLGSRLQARVEASDIVQQTYLEAHRDLAKFSGQQPGEFVTWLHTILDHNILEAFRAHIRAAKRSVDQEVRREAVDRSEEAPSWEPPAETSSPSRRLMRGEAAIRLAQAIDQLPADQSEAVRLRHLEGWTLAQLAAHFERSEVAVAGLLKRGLRGLRDKFACSSRTVVP